MEMIIHCSVELRHQSNHVSKHGATTTLLVVCAEDCDFTLVSRAK